MCKPKSGRVSVTVNEDCRWETPLDSLTVSADVTYLPTTRKTPAPEKTEYNLEEHPCLQNSNQLKSLTALLTQTFVLFCLLSSKRSWCPKSSNSTEKPLRGSGRLKGNQNVRPFKRPSRGRGGSVGVPDSIRLLRRLVLLYFRHDFWSRGRHLLRWGRDPQACASARSAPLRTDAPRAEQKSPTGETPPGQR